MYATTQPIWRRNFASTLAIAVLASILLFPTTTQAFYTCQTQNGHCYGISQWYGWMRGAATSITIDSGTTGSGQYSQEIWVGSQRDTRSGCVEFNNYCWVEAGYILHANQSPPGWYFYAYVDPTRSYGDSYREFDLDPVRAGQGGDVGGYLGITIDRDINYYWYIQFSTPHGVENSNPFLAFVDTANVFNDNSLPVIQTGREVVASGVTLPASAWTWNQFIDLNNVVHVQTNPQPGNPCNPSNPGWCWGIDAPVSALFWPGQYPSQVYWGGTWYVYASP